MALPADHLTTAITRPRGSWDVLAFIGSLDIGGCERHLATVYPLLAAAGLKVGIVTIKQGGLLEKEVRAKGIEIWCIDRGLARRLRPLLGRWLSSYLAVLIGIADIARLLRSGRVAIAHFFLPSAYVLGGLAAVLARHPNAVMSRRSLNDYQVAHPRASGVERFLHGRMRLLIANANAVRAQLIDEGAPPGRTLVLYSGVDLAQLASVNDRQAGRDRFSLESDALVIAIVANLIPYKGHTDLIEALGRIASQIEGKWVLLVAGRDDGVRTSLQERAAALGIAENIRWLGIVDDVLALWRAADIGVLASHQEGLPNSLMEGMALGVPMVATAVGGVNDIATDGLDAILVRPRDPGALGSALLQLIRDSSLRARLGRAAAARIASDFPLTACVDGYWRLYQLMLHQPNAAGEDIARQFQDRLSSNSNGTAR
jgi:glycosyltransferase involved in cell wall biosynthesis